MSEAPADFLPCYARNVIVHVNEANFLHDLSGGNRRHRFMLDAEAIGDKRRKS